MAGFDEMVLVGRIARPHGLRGAVIVNSETDFPEQRFAIGEELHAWRNGAHVTLRVAAMRLHQGRPVIVFEGIGSMTEAEQLAGLELRIPESALRPLPAGRYYEHDLIGCTVVTTSGRELGPVRTVEGGAGLARLVIGEGRGEIQIPLVEEFCPVIDVADRRIVVDPPEGLLELNA
jgi:16S rRNA processing protein RimM